MSDLKTYIGIYLRGDAGAKAREMERAFGQLASKGQRHLGMLSRSMGMVGGGLDRLANRYTALLSGAAGAGAVKMVSDLDTRMTYLGIQAGKTTAEMDALKRKVFEIAQAPDIRVDPTQMLDAIDAIVERTGELPLAEENLRNIGLAIRATAATGVNIGGLISELATKFRIQDADKLLQTLDQLTNQGKAGAFTLANLAAQGPRLTSAYAATGRVGEQAALELGAMMQMIMKGVAGPEQAATAFEALMRTLSDAEKVKKLTAAGIQLTDPEDPARLRSITEIVKDLVTKSKGDMVKLSTIFDGEAIRALNAVVVEFKQTGQFGSLDSFLAVAGDGATLLDDAGKAAKTFGAATQYLNTAWRQFADANLTEPVRELADLLNRLEPEKVQATMKALAWGAGALGAAIVAKKGIDAAIWTRNTLGYIRGGRGGRAAGLAAGAAGAAGIGGPMPVVVMNWPLGAASALGGMGGATGAPVPPAGGARRGLAGLMARGGRLLGGAGRLFLPLALLEGGISAAGALMAGDTAGAAGAGGRVAGGLAGAAAGAAAGSVVPVVGTAAGGLIGGILGALGGEQLFRSIAEWFASDQKEKKAEVGGKIEIAISSQAPVKVAALHSTNRDVPLDVDVGPTMVLP